MTGLPLRRTTANPGEKYDVAVLGGHLASSLLAAILARHGVDVLLVDAEPDMTQPSGETTVPYTAEVFFTLAQRFDIPQIAAFGMFSDLPADIRRTSGVKRSISFLYHVEGREHAPQHTIQFNVPKEHRESHFYRPHIDQFAHKIAYGYGAAVIPHRSPLVDVNIKDDEVHVLVANGQTYRVRYVVDGSGPDSPLLQRLLEQRPRLRHRTRVLATHMHDVRPFEECTPLAGHARATPWSQGTLSHLFDGGWLQVVPFGNHDEAANSLCSVTLSLDPDRFPAISQWPAEAFRQVISRFPSVSRQFEYAVAVRPWTAENEWQRSATATSGDRYFIFDRSASRNDLFLSRDVTMSAEVVHALAAGLLAVARTGDWSGNALARVARIQDAIINFNDRILEAARIACGDFQLWNAFSRVWLLQSILAALSLKQARNGCLADPRHDAWSRIERFEDGPFWFPMPNGVHDLLETTFERCLQVRDGKLEPKAAAERIFADLDRAPFAPPLYGFGDPNDRYYVFSLRKRLRMLLWVKTTAPEDFRRMLTKENITAVAPSSS